MNVAELMKSQIRALIVILEMKSLNQCLERAVFDLRPSFLQRDGERILMRERSQWKTQG